MDLDIWASQLALVDLRAGIPLNSDLRIRKKIFRFYEGRNKYIKR